MSARVPSRFRPSGLACGLTLVAALGLAGSAIPLVGCRHEEAPAPAGSASAAPNDAAATAVPSGVLPANVTVSTDLPKAIGFQRYENKRFGFEMDYPTFAKIEPPVEAQDQQAFDYFDRVHILVRALPAANGPSLDDRYRDALVTGENGRRVVTEKTRTADGFVVLATAGDRGYYLRVHTDGKTVLFLTIDYELASKEKFEKAARHVGESLHFGLHAKVPAGAIPASVP